ncbi:MAG: hypothetical protein GKR90_26710 [Pseudomonadales bacterium]|nr:hypothetical protein [Pseudomonadales bacterium]
MLSVIFLSVVGTAACVDLDEPLCRPGFASEKISAPVAGSNSLAEMDSMDMHVYRGRDFDSERGRIVFVQHGTKRNAKSYVRMAARFADDALVIGLTYDRARYPTGCAYTLGMHHPFTREKFNGAQVRAHYAQIEAVFDLVRTRIGGQQQRYDMFGHSAGAQFVHRYLLFFPDARVRYAVAANAGWYTLPDLTIPFPYGLAATDVDQHSLRRSLAQKLVVMAGALDTQQKGLRTSPRAMRQGPHRRARAKHFVHMARKVGADWQYCEVPGVGHSPAQMLAAFFEAVLSGSSRRCLKVYR